MASPQTENGYTMIANELFDALIRVPIGNSNAQVLYAIIRKTYGWHKREDKISISQLCKATNCSRRTVIYALQNLEAKRIIIIKRSKKSGAENDINNISLNKNYQQWVVQEIAQQYRKALEQRKKLYYESKKGVVQEKKGSARNGEKVVQEMVNDVRFLAPTKETITKDIIQKKKEYAGVPPLKDVKEFSLPKVGVDIQDLADKLYEEKKFPKVHAFVNSQVKNKVNKRAILHALTRVYLKPSDNKDFNPWAYALQIIKVEDGNYNEQFFRKVTPKDS